LEERAKRRRNQNISDLDIKAVMDNLQKRDHEDETRKASPLIISNDVIVIDTSHLSISEVVDKVIAIIRGSDA